MFFLVFHCTCSGRLCLTCTKVSRKTAALLCMGLQHLQTDRMERSFGIGILVFLGASVHMSPASLNGKSCHTLALQFLAIAKAAKGFTKCNCAYPGCPQVLGKTSMHRWPGAGALSLSPWGQPSTVLDDSKANGLRCLLGTQRSIPSLSRRNGMVLLKSDSKWGGHAIS